MSPLPTLVLVHGSWHQANCYDKIVKLLQPKLKCIAVSLPSMANNPEATFKDDMDTVSAAIADETSNGRNVIVVAHSYGGMPANSAIKGFAKPKDLSTDSAQSSDKGYVVGLILIASGFALAGLSFMDPFFGNPPPQWKVNKETGYADIVVSPREFFYHDVPDDEVEYWISQLTTQSLKALFEGGEYAYEGWRDVPVWYIGTSEDKGLPVAAQRLGVGAARSMGARVEHRELQTSHSPFLSQPEATVEIMLEAVKDFTGVAVQLDEEDKSKAVVTLPRAMLFRPLSWFRFGLPLAFGHFVGKSILLFRWGRSLWRS